MFTKGVCCLCTTYVASEVSQSQLSSDMALKHAQELQTTDGQLVTLGNR